MALHCEGIRVLWIGQLMEGLAEAKVEVRGSIFLFVHGKNN